MHWETKKLVTRFIAIFTLLQFGTEHTVSLRCVCTVNPKYVLRMLNIINFYMAQDPPLSTSLLCIMLSYDIGSNTWQILCKRTLNEYTLHIEE